LTYGLERIAAFLQDVDSIYDITWVVDPDGRPVKYGEIRLKDELQFSVYNFEHADVAKAWTHLELYEAECQALLNEYAAMAKAKRESESPAGDSGDKRRAKSGDPAPGEEPRAKSEEQMLASRRFPILGAFDLCLKCSHLFNVLDARGAISVTERVGVIARIRALAVGVAKAYVDQQKAEADFSQPLPTPKEADEDGALGGKASAQLAATRS
jgi:glycyl-tRNA synthetase alpha chain